VDEAKALGRRVQEVRSWRGLTLREAAGLAGLSFSFWGQVERVDKAVTNRRTLEAMAGALRVHPVELAGQPWTPGDPVGADAQAGLDAIETVLDYELGTDPGLPARAWPAIATDLERLVKLRHCASDFAAIGELAPGLIRELHGAYLHMPHQRSEVLVSLMKAYHAVMSTAHYLGGTAVRGDLGRPGMAGLCRLATRCHHGTSRSRRAVPALGGRSRETQTSQLNDQDAVQACGMLHLSAALAAGVQSDHGTAATHLDEASALAARMNTEVGTWAHLWFGSTNVGIWRTSIALDVGEHGKALEAAKLLPGTNRQAEFWAEVGRALIAGKKTRDKGVRVLLLAEQLAPQRIRRDLLVREAVADLLRQTRRDAGGRELRGLAWRMGVAPLG
jgi:transcriptional regulator with XRE-family HTH domain